MENSNKNLSNEAVTGCAWDAASGRRSGNAHDDYDDYAEEIDDSNQPSSLGGGDSLVLRGAALQAHQADRER